MTATMNDELISQIEELGLSNKEARVYTANLMLGPAGVQQIADASGIKRVTTYVILESLVNLGLVSQTSKAKKTLFNAESPENLRRLLEKREQSIQDQRHHLEELLPQLSTLQTLPKDAPGTRLYEGEDGLRAMVELYIDRHPKDSPLKIYGVSNMDLVYRFFPEVEELQIDPSRLKAGLSSKLLYTSKRGPILRDSDTQRNRESRFLPIEKFPFSCDLTITSNSVAFMSLGGSKPMGITIESEEITAGVRMLFDLAWQSAKEYN
jgi:sugar-specific transcriptional regulator TrmB